MEFRDSVGSETGTLTVLDWFEITSNPYDWVVTHTEALNDPGYWDWNRKDR